MALLFGSVNGYIICVIVLCCVLPSHQGDCPSGFNFPSIKEGPGSNGTILFSSIAITNLTLTNNGNGYLAVRAEPSGTNTNFSLYIAREIDAETLMQNTISGSVVCADATNSFGYKPNDLLVTIDGVNEFPPQFTGAPYTVNVTENTESGSSIFSFQNRTYDPDKPQDFQIAIGIVNTNSPFLITNGVTVLLNQTIDYENGPHEYVLNISASERAQNGPNINYTTLTIYITDIDDIGPIFTNNAAYTLTLPEGVYKGNVFSTEPVLSATDGDSFLEPIGYELDATSQGLSDKFAVLANGSLNVTGTLQPGQMTINIRAYQVNRPIDRFAVATVAVTVVDINDNPPVMSNSTYSGSVLEAAVPGTVVLTVAASDKDQGANNSFQFHLNDTSVPFSISTENGVGILLVSGLLDREKTDSYILHVYAEEDLTAEHRRSNMSVIHIAVLDINDHTPQFWGEPYNFFVNETDGAHHFVGWVNATDEDIGNNGKVLYSILSASSLYSIDSTTGEITLARALTQQDVGVVHFDVEAKDNATGQAMRSRSTRVTVTVLAVNQYPPQFTSQSFVFTVEETVHVGYIIGTLGATDADDDTLVYQLESAGKDFRLEGNPPKLVVNGSLDLDDNSQQTREHTFDVSVSDGQHEIRTTVSVNITTVNEYPPVFSQSAYVVNVMENETKGYQIVQVSATDRDKWADGLISYNLDASSGNLTFFAVDSTSGVVTLRCDSCLDYRVKRQYTLIVTATDHGQPAKSAYCTIIISIQDVNNKAPKLVQASLTGSVAEDAVIGTTVLRLQAVDDDTPISQLTYRLVNMTSAGWLRLDGANIVTNSLLDADYSQSIGATVTVSDGIQSDTGHLNVTVIDVNDNYPQIILSSNSVDIPENATVGTIVTTVRAEDHDVTQSGSFLFYQGSAPSGKFSIDSSSGQITVIAPFDRRIRKEYDINITVSDNSAPPKINSTILHIDITDSNSAPVFVNSNNVSVKAYYFNISETEDVGYVIGFTSALDPDSGSSGDIHYNIQSGNEQGMFHLDEDTGQLSLLQKLDYEQNPKSYSLKVTATDNSLEPKEVTATVTIQVEDVIEAPEWPSFLPVVHLTTSQQCDDVQVGARFQDIVQASSLSQQSGVIYSLLNYTDSFSINNHTGLLRTLGAGTLAVRTYHLGLQACSMLDNSVCSDTVLTIEVSDDDVITFCPPFHTVHVNESESSGYILIDLNSTKGDINITYSLQDDQQQTFGINATTGVIKVLKTLDREETPRYTLEIIALYRPSQGSATAQVTVVVDDAPDTPPRFQWPRYNGEIRENAPVGSPVLNVLTKLPLIVAATDDDLNPTLEFTIPPNDDNSNGAFSINLTSGEITLQRSIDLENITQDFNGQYTLTVMVTDGIFSNNSTLVVQVLNENDNPPRFIPDVLNFNVSESTHSGYSIGTVSAIDSDVGDPLQYSLINMGPIPFKITPSGELRLNGELDRETVPSYTFTVVATDSGGQNGTAEVNINVTDANEPPHFDNATYTFHVFEGSQGVGVSLMLRATDSDVGSNAVLSFHIQSGDQDNHFNITNVNRTSAQLSVIKELDRETTPSIILSIRAMDAGQPPKYATCTVEVVVEDVNDHPPEFSFPTYTAEISEGANNNTPLYLTPELSVHDGDIGVYGSQGVVFYLEPAFPHVPFQIHPTAGTIHVSFFNATDHLDRETTPSYKLTVLARDNNGKGLNGTAELVISITNINDHGPVFPQTFYQFNISENVPVGYLLTTLNATDTDSEQSLLRFHIHTLDPHFYLNPVSGELRISGPLDRETQDHYSLALGVYDGRYWGNATADITVDDVNDNCPVFNERQPLVLSVLENRGPTIIYTLNVTDSDFGSNADVTLFINDTVASLYLAVNANGSLHTTQKLDREKDDQHSVDFTVWARDAGSPPCVSSQRVQLNVLGENEEAPSVCQITTQQHSHCGQNIPVVAFDRDPEGTFLSALSWKDSDEGDGGQATLYLESDPGQVFRLNQTSPTTSILTLNRSLDKGVLYTSDYLEEDNTTYQAVVRAEDKGTSPRNSSVVLTLTILQPPSTIPHFSSAVYSFSVLENQPMTVIGNVNATSQDGEHQVNYALNSESDFTIDNKGNISAESQLDRETIDQYTFLVLAWESSNHTKTATAVVMVTVLDENDNAPHFSAGPVYYHSIPENLSGVSIMKLFATDDDTGENGKIAYSLVNSSFDGMFVLDSTSGQLWLNKSLDRETKSSYTLTVQASDGGSPSKSAQATVEITVLDVNDNSPVFSEQHYVAYLDEKVPATTPVINVSATDFDAGLNGHVLYQFVSSNLSTHFFINEFSGAIYTSHSFQFTSQQTFNLTVEAKDLGNPPMISQTSVSVYVNDLSTVLPQLKFDPDTVALVLGTPANTLLPVNVSGGFGNYNYSIVGGNEEGLFSLDKDSGQITVSRELTRAITHQLTIRATNLDAPQYHADGTLTVVVTTVRMDQERYAAVITEHSPPPYLLLDINSNAEKAGIPVTYHLRGDGVATGTFRIESDTGKLYCDEQLDRETHSEYILWVSVSLTSTSSSTRKKREVSNETEIRVIVEDINDNEPRFEVSTNLFGIPSSAPADTLVTTLQAVDPDSGAGGQIQYTLLGGDTTTFFITAKGQVKTLVSMSDKKIGQQFTLTVQATDNNGVCVSSNNGPSCKSSQIEMKIVVVPNSDRFGLVANVSVNTFTDNQQLYLRNLSNILNMTLQLDKVEPHQSVTIDTSKSDIYFYAFDSNGKSVPFSTISERVKANTAAINALFSLSSVQLIPVTEPPVLVRVQTDSAMGEAEIAVIVVACLIFIGSFVAIILTIRAWKKQKELQEREEAAVRARQRLEQETRELADKLQETSFVADPEEPLELYRSNAAPVSVPTEDQECVMTFGNESRGMDTIALRHTVRQTEVTELEALMEEEPTPPDNNESDSGTENNNGSLSSEERQDNGSTHGETQRSAAASEDSGASSVGQTPPHTPHHPSTPSSSHEQSTLQPSHAGLHSFQDCENEPSELDDSNTNSREGESVCEEDLSVTNESKQGENVDDTKTSTPAEDDSRLEDPEPDYQKRVSFATVVDMQDDNTEGVDDSIQDQTQDSSDVHELDPPQGDYVSATAKLLDNFYAKKSEGLSMINPVFQGDEKVMDGWAEDYDSQAQSSEEELSTAL